MTKPSRPKNYQKLLAKELMRNKFLSDKSEENKSSTFYVRLKGLH